MLLSTSDNGAYGPFDIKENAEKALLHMATHNDGLHYWIIEGEKIPSQQGRDDLIFHAERFGLAKKQNLFDRSRLAQMVREALYIEKLREKNNKPRKI